MRTIMLAIVAVAGLGLASISGTSAAPINGAAIDQAAQANQLTVQVHCRRYPHRHWRGRPHGWGFGCR